MEQTVTRLRYFCNPNFDKTSYKGSLVLAGFLDQVCEKSSVANFCATYRKIGLLYDLAHGHTAAVPFYKVSFGV